MTTVQAAGHFRVRILMQTRAGRRRRKDKEGEKGAQRRGATPELRYSKEDWVESQYSVSLHDNHAVIKRKLAGQRWMPPKKNPKAPSTISEPQGLSLPRSRLA